MLKPLLATSLILALSSCDDNDKPKARPTPTGCTPAKAWTIGPIIKGENYSKGLPLNPCTEPGSGFSFDLGGEKEPHYITRKIDSLVGKKQLRMSFRVEASASTLVYGAKCPTNSPSAVTLYIQREDDDWQKNGWRWWHGPSRVAVSGAGVWELIAPLDDPKWSSVQGMTADASPLNWKATITDPYVVGFTMANCEGAGHGARATAPAKVIVERFSVE